MPADHVSRIQAEWHATRPELDVSPSGVIGRLHRLAAALTEELVAVYREYGLSEGEFDVLSALRRAGAPFERAPSELAKHTMVTTSAITKRIDRLESAGFVRRWQSDSDGRGRVVGLTEAGVALIDRAFEHHMRNERRLLGELEPDDAAQLERILTLWLSRHEA